MNDGWLEVMVKTLLQLSASAPAWRMLSRLYLSELCIVRHVGALADSWRGVFTITSSQPSFLRIACSD